MTRGFAGWHHDPKQRPTAQQLCQGLEALIALEAAGEKARGVIDKDLQLLASPTAKAQSPAGSSTSSPKVPVGAKTTRPMPGSDSDSSADSKRSSGSRNGKISSSDGSAGDAQHISDSADPVLQSQSSGSSGSLRGSGVGYAVPSSMHSLNSTIGSPTKELAGKKSTGSTSRFGGLGFLSGSGGARGNESINGDGNGNGNGKHLSSTSDSADVVIAPSSA